MNKNTEKKLIEAFDRKQSERNKLLSEIQELEEAIRIKLIHERNQRIRLLSECPRDELVSDLIVKQKKLKELGDTECP